MGPPPQQPDGPQQPGTNPLVCQPYASFQQQGQFDWFGLARSTVDWSVGVFARLSAAGVDQYTAIVAQNLCPLFRLGPIGRSNMNAALTELPSFRSLSDAVWFGIGTRHLLRDLAITDQGTLCIGICASLSSCYSEELAAEVLAEMVSVSKAPVELMPSLLEWKKLVHGVNGALHMSPFPRHAERLISLFPTIQPLTELERSGPTCSLPSSLAKALLAIGDVTRGAVEAITIAGGADAGWLAAICEWLFGLHIRILSWKGNILYASEDRTGLSKKVQVLFRYHSDNGEPMAEVRESMEVQCLERVYYLEEAKKLFQSPVTGFMEGTGTMPRVSGRLSWETALSQAFRPEIKSLFGMSEVMGQAIGTAARALTAIVHNENKIYEAIWQDPDTNQKWPRHSDTAHGRGFINSIVYWFPELEPLQATMEDAVRLSYRDAKSVYETQLSLVQKACLCSFCRNDFVHDSKGHGFCKVVILETIIYLGQMLSSVSADRRLGLKRHGIEAIYQTILYNRLSTGPDFGIQHRIHGAFHFGLCYSNLRRLHLDVLELFAGEAAEQPSYTFGTSAYSQAGICTYLNILGEVTDSKELVGLIHVTPGRIEYHGRPYDCLQDGEPLAMQTRELYKRGNTNTKRLMDLEYRLKHLGSYDKPVMRVKQHVGGLQTWFESESRRGEKASVVMRPEELARSIATSRGFIHCSGRGACAVVNPGIRLPAPGECAAQEQLGKVILIVRGSSLMRCLALNGTKCEYDLLLRSDECIQCCMRAALASPRERIIIIIGE